MLINPTVETLQADDAMANAGTLEIIPLEQPLTLFVWSKSRVVPVRLTEFSITEEAFDPNLNPIRAKVSLGMRVLNVDDLGFAPSRRPHVHDLSQPTRNSWPRGDLCRAHACSDWEAAMNYPLQALIALGVDARRSPSRPTAATTVRRRCSTPRRRADVTYLARRYRAAARRAEFRHDRQHVVVQGDRLDLIAAQVSRRPADVLADLRRQRRDASRRAGRDAGHGAEHHHAAGRAGRHQCLGASS